MEPFIFKKLMSPAYLVHFGKIKHLFQKVMFIISIVVFSGFTINAQVSEIIVDGYVKDNLGSPLVGVNVIVKGSSNCAITNLQGYYKITIKPTDRFLVYSLIGMEIETIEIGQRKRIDVVMKPDETKLEEIEVVGYGRKELLPGISILKSPPKRRERETNSFMANSVVTVSCESDFNTENYSAIGENGYKEVSREPLSTFSVDVDKASYSNIRRFINMGQMPPADAVRVEEMINYFDYNYKAPSGDHPFAVHPEMAICPWNSQHFLLKIGLKGHEIEKEDLPPSNLVFLIDVSGSMSPANKLPLLKSAFHMLVNELRPHDKVSIVVYAGASGCVLEPTPGNKKQTIIDALTKLEAGGSTAGGAGLKLAYKKAAESFIKGGNNRIILATDGDFNVGVSSNAEMEKLVSEKKDEGIFITVLGFGMGNYKDDRLEIIANKGNGNYAYIDNIQEAQKTLVKEFGGTLFTIAKDVKFQIEFNPSKVLAYRLIGFENRLLNAEDFNDDKKDAGEIGAGHTVTALYEIIPTGAEDAEKWMKKTDRLKYQAPTLKIATTHNEEWLNLKLRYKKPDGNSSILIEIPVMGKINPFENAADDFRFAASVAGFGMMLRNSEYKGSLTYSKVISMALKAKGNDNDGYKAEMIRLAKTAENLTRNLVVAD